MTIRYGFTPVDQGRIAAARAALDKISSTGNPIFPEPRLLPPGSSLHYQGTHRLGAQDDGSSVCDPTCRVWGVKNLFLGGNGLIPTETACNPTLTSVALATIGAEEIVRHLRPPTANKCVSGIGRGTRLGVDRCLAPLQAAKR
jgi:choline dehydrogenase-like flavoprotein